MISLAGCASAPRHELVDCTRELSLARGLKDGAAGRRPHHGFIEACSEGTRELAASAYGEGFTAGRGRRKANLAALREEAGEANLEEGEANSAEVLMPLPSSSSSPSASSWVCEIEASSKIFTGIGESKGEALGSAKANCGSHFQASHCTKSDCRQSW